MYNKSNEIRELVKQRLKDEGLKLTSQRRTILDVILESENKHLMTEEIYELVKKVAPEIGLATVYRTVQLFEDIKIIKKMDLHDRCAVYELVGEEGEHQHHHLICESCGLVQEVRDDLLEELESVIEKQYSFEIKDHSVKFFGICAKCKEKRSKE